MANHIKFRDVDEYGNEVILTLWVEKYIDDSMGLEWPVGWCPERNNNILVDPHNVVDEVPAA